MSSHDPSSTDLIQEPVEGVVAALEFDAEDAWLQRLARRLVRDEDEARDLAQETWLAALRTPPRDGELRAWLTATARKLAARRWRRREDSFEGLETPPLDEEEPVARAARADAAGHLHSALAGLSERDRHLVVWRWHEGLSYTEIAARLGLTRQSATYRVDRALDALRSSLRRRAPGSSLLGLVPLLIPFEGQKRISVLPVAVVAAAGVLAALVTVLALPPAGMKTLHAGAPEGTLLAQAPSNAELVGEMTDPGGGPNRLLATAPDGEALQVVPPIAQPPSKPSLGVVQVSGSWTLNEKGAQGWVAKLTPLGQGQKVLRLEGQGLLDETGSFTIQGGQPGEYLLDIHRLPAEGRQGFQLALPYIHDQSSVEINVDTGSLRLGTSYEGRIWVIATNYYGRFMAHAEVEDGEALFPLLPAGEMKLYLDDWPVVVEEGTLLGVVTIQAGQELVIEL